MKVQSLFLMSKKPESRLQKSIQLALVKAYPKSFWFKTWGGPFQMIGLPDLIGCVDGKFFGLEVKVPGKKHQLKPIQLYVLKLIRKAGGTGEVVESKKEALDVIRHSLSSPKARR